MIRDKVRIGFNPLIERGLVGKVFANDMARLLWLAIRPGHITNQDICEGCLELAWEIEKEMRKSGKLNYDQLQGMYERIFSPGALASVEKDFILELLPFVNGERKMTFEIA